MCWNLLRLGAAPGNARYGEELVAGIKTKNLQRMAAPVMYNNMCIKFKLAKQGSSEMLNHCLFACASCYRQIQTTVTSSLCR